MKNCLLVLFIIGCLTTAQIMACDVCACYMGILPNEKESSIGLYYRYKAGVNTFYSGNTWFPEGALLRSAHGSMSETDKWESSYELYRVTELRAKYFFSPKVECNLVIPYVSNVDERASRTVRIKGMGDISLFGGWYFIDQTDEYVWRHRAVAGMGLKMPTGNAAAAFAGERISLVQQAGTGSVDPILYGVYSLGYRNWGFRFAATYKVNGRNRYEEKLANSSTLNSAVFYKFRLQPECTLMGSAQLYSENCKGLYLQDALQPGTTMRLTTFGGGVDLYYKRISWTCALQWPIRETVEKNMPETTLKGMVGFTWIFPQAKFIARDKN